MPDPTIGPDTIEVVADLGTGDTALYDWCMGQERIAEKEEGNWPKRGRAIIQRYRDERPESVRAVHRFNILWSNVQTLTPTLYARTPKPDVERRFRDQDDVGRLAGILLERCLSYALTDTEDESDFDAVMEACVQEKLLSGRGTARILYVPHYGDEIEEAAEEYRESEQSPSIISSPSDQPQDPLRKVVYEEVVPVHVYWEDYREGPARSWREVPWVRYRAYMTRQELIDRFGKKKGSQVNLDFSGEKSKQDAKGDVPRDIFKKATIHEMWDKEAKRVIWYAPHTPGLILDKVDDPLELPGFFPGPDPLFATMTTNKRVPVPDFIEYQDQAQELDKITARIDRLTRALKVSGVYPGAQKQVLQQLIDEGTENRLIPVEDWTAFAADKGGLQNMIQWLPIKEIAETLIRLYDARDRTKQMLYEITGIGDIMRGETQPMETATAQRMKSNFVTRRVVPQQRQVARFARDVIRLMAAVIANHFSAETISKITGYPQLLPVPQFPPAPPQFIAAPPQAGTTPATPMPAPMPQQQPMQPRPGMVA